MTKLLPLLVILLTFTYGFGTISYSIKETENNINYLTESISVSKPIIKNLNCSIQIEQEKLEEKLAYLENLPPDAFANSRSRNVIIGKYQYRLQQLLSDPDSYFDKYGF